MLKKFGIGLGIFIVFLYALFLILPIFLTSWINSYDIPKIAEEATGYKVKVENIKLVTTPKLTIGAKAKYVEISLPTGENILTSENLQGKMSLIPLLSKKVEIDMIGAENINLNLKVKKDGHFLIEDYIPESSESTTPAPQNFSLPFGLKLSNHLPNVIVNKYNISFIDIPTNNSYSINGDNFSISDFILNKKIRILTEGKIKLQDREQFKYNIKVFNQIMPNWDLNELLFAPKVEEEKQKSQDFAINIIDVFKTIYNNNLTADVSADIKTSGTLEDINFDGTANISEFSVAVDGKSLPNGNANFKLKGNKIDILSKLYTGNDEITEINGLFSTGKNTKIDINCKSNAKFQSIIDLADSVAKSFGINTLDTLSATGGINADFRIKSDLKTVESSGYLKIPSASLAYKLYNVAIEKIFADIQLANNSINIKDSSLSILGQPLKIQGTISQNADANISVIADKLPIKGLFLALGQASILKENNINNGTISINALIKGKLDKIVPKVYISIDNVNVKNIPSNTTITAVNSMVNLTTDGIKTNGNIDINNVKILNPMATISAPSAKIVFGEKDININSAYILLNNSRIDITGKVSDYMTKNINFDILANGNLLASDLKAMIPKEFRNEVYAKGSLPLKIMITGNDKTQDINFNLNANTSNYLSVISVDQLKGKASEIKGNIKIKGDSLTFNNTGFYSGGAALAYLKGGISDLYKNQKLNLNFSTPNNISMVIPFFSKSKMNIGGNIDIGGTAANPTLKGSVDIPTIKMPEMALTIDELAISLNGAIAKGKGTIKKLVSGTIIAENLASDFNLNLTNNILYLKNLTGDAFEGKINGNISYNINNGYIGVDMKGTGMNAEKAIAGAAGIKNALSGKLNFNANITTHGETDVLMMKNLKGKASFEINDGEFGNIGRFENLIMAQNIQSNPIIKAGVDSIRALPVIKNTAQFKSITGNMTFSDGWVNLSPVKTTGPSMAYYITGKYNLLNNTANLIILGRISAEVVKILGPLGDLSVSKLTSFIPGVGSSTVKLVNAITTNPYGEKISEIPSLSSGNTNYKDFKVQFNGGVESTSSVKSFRWLSVCDTSEIESLTVKEQVQVTKQAIKDAKEQVNNAAKEAVQSKIDAINKQLTEQRQQAQQANQELKNAAEGLKNLFKAPKSTETPTETTNQTSTENVQEVENNNE